VLLAWLYRPLQIILDILGAKPQFAADFDEGDFPLVSELDDGLGINL
jgi:hypothetical protein